MAFMGMGVNATGGALAGLQQPVPQQQQQQQQPAPPPAPAAESTPEPAAEDPVAKLTQLKTMLDAGLITQEDYDNAKSKILGF